MPIYQESGLMINLPDEQSFRFQDHPAYQKLKGKGLSEMDFAWWDATKNILWLLDVKDYSHLLPAEKLPDYLLAKLSNKVIDSLLIMSAIWSNTQQGLNLKMYLPESCQITQPLKIVFVFKITNQTIKASLSPLKTKLVNSLQGKLLLFDLKNVTLVDHEIAIKMGLPLTVTSINSL
jgi:hypothetical protein